ncbi:substrate-binding domain-containing protein [Cysteiniphilum marinum]|uniref:substrate-binding domain-containing protein n=1 Tax=Cysteiniphilum marinum TaxID=2774191 RepID=UPI001F2FAD07|nr:substrate-binding domain-containing protein [Cysteiniphilum marinum]
MGYIIIALIVITVLITLNYRKASDKDVGIVISNTNNKFFGNITLGISKELNQYGYIPYALNAKDDLDRSIESVKSFVNRNFKVIIFNPVDSNQSSEAITYAKAHNVKIITLDRSINGAEVLSHIDSNNEQGGEIAADYILSKLGKSAKVLELTGVQGSSSTKERAEAFAEAMKSKGAEIIASYSADYNERIAESITYNVLQANKNINAIFAQNDLMALGAARAAKLLKRKVLIVGYDGIPEAITAIKDGRIAATVQQQPIEMGKLAAEVAMNYMQGTPKELHHQHDVQVKLITKENVNEAWGSKTR